MSRSGVRQGDPLGPLLFALALQKPFQGALQAAPGADGVAFLDDCTVVGRPACIQAFMEVLDGNGANSVRSVGLRIRRDKCGVHGGTRTSGADLAAALRVPHNPEGLTVVGVPIGSTSYKNGVVGKRAGKVVSLIDKCAAFASCPSNHRCSFSGAR